MTRLQENTSAQFVRDVLHSQEAPPPVAVRYFYTSPLAIDDPLSPLPPSLVSSTASYKAPPRPFSAYDNAALEKVWLQTRKKLLQNAEQHRREKSSSRDGKTPAASGSKPRPLSGRYQAATESKRRSLGGSSGSSYKAPESPPQKPQRVPSPGHSPSPRKPSTELEAPEDQGSTPYSALDQAGSSLPSETTLTTGNPFIRAPSRTDVRESPRARSTSRPVPNPSDSYNWGEDGTTSERSAEHRRQRGSVGSITSAPSARVPVGVSRLHNVLIPDLQMEPIYWSPVNDIAPVVRGTWFYADNMLPVEAEVANMLEAGYISLQPWTETWNDELNSAMEVGALGEMKILHKLWPEPPKKTSPPSTSRAEGGLLEIVGSMNPPVQDLEKEREELVATAGDLIDIATGPDGPDNKAAGQTPYGHDGTIRQYLRAGVIYANSKDAYLLRPSLQPSDYYGRKPLASYIRKGRSIGIRVVRGYDQDVWEKLHPPKKDALASKAREGVSTSQAGAPPLERRLYDSTLAGSRRPEVTDLVLVIHGIGQKLSERVESYHFTHAINAFRREVNVELGTNVVKAHFRREMGGIMVLPVNWRLTLSFEDGGYREEADDPALNEYTLKDITPQSLPSVRSIVSDVMLDIPYYLSHEHSPKMIAAVVGEANRIYRLWCANNPGFENVGRVHLIAHSLGSVMAIDILSNQPTYVPASFKSQTTPVEDLPVNHFAFDVTNVFTIGSPCGFFLLLKRGNLLPRIDREKPGADDYNNSIAGVSGKQGTYGCIAVDNLYNVINPYDPIAYHMNACVDAPYASTLKPALVPSSSSSVFSFSNPFKAAQPPQALPLGKPVVPRLPSNVELETHDFTREEIAENRAYLLNDNGQIDWLLRYGGGPLEIQYLTMLGAHSSYWLSRDFVRMVVQEIGRQPGREGTLLAMRAVKKKPAAR